EISQPTPKIPRLPPRPPPQTPIHTPPVLRSRHRSLTLSSLHSTCRSLFFFSNPPIRLTQLSLTLVSPPEHQRLSNPVTCCKNGCIRRMEHQVISQGSSDEEDTSTGGSGAGTERVLDYTNEFTTDEIFKSRDALVEWTRDRGNSNGLVIIIKNSDAGGAGNKKPRIKFCCEKGGVYKRKIDENVHKKRRLRSSGTKKCGCPFLLRGVSLGDNDEWKLEVVCGVHNHDAAKSNARRLSEEEKALLVDMSKSLAKPKDILRTIKQKDGLNETTMKTIYNVRQRLKLKENVVRSQMHVLLSKLSDHNYIEWHRSSDDNNIVKDLFWTHPVSVDILRAFPHVLIMDCTCKTYSFPLLEIVGVTCTNINFSAAFAYLDAKNEDNYIWALSRLRLCWMNIVFLHKNVLAKCKGMFEGKDQLEKFIMSWNMLVLSETEHEYLKRLAELDYYFGRYPHALEYVKNTWLNEYKERFVSVWTDTCMHFGHTTSNRVEGASAKLKQLLGNSRGSFETSWEKIHSLLELQHLDIKVSLEKCLTIIQHNFMHDELKELRGFVSTVALTIIVCESKKVNSVGLDSRHVVAPFDAHMGCHTSRPIPLYCVDPHWRKLDLLYSPKNSDHATDIITQMYTILHQWMDSNGDTRRHISLKLEEIMNMESIPLTKPKEQPNCYRIPLGETKEASSQDEGDGNCGYRVIAGLMGFGDDSWSKVRRDLLNELCSHETQFENLFGRRDQDYVIALVRAPSHCHRFSQQQPLCSGHPMPPVSDCWHQVYLPDAEGWQTAYTERIQRFREIVGSDVATRETA
ncbi:Myzus persicae-induced lipase 1, partial [Prunus dulcis]